MEFFTDQIQIYSRLTPSLTRFETWFDSYAIESVMLP